jgi:hypothetical protein
MPLEGAVRALGRDDPSALLAAMLQGIQAVVSQGGCVRMSKHGKDAAFVGRFVVFH